MQPSGRNQNEDGLISCLLPTRCCMAFFVCFDACIQAGAQETRIRHLARQQQNNVFTS